MDRSQGRRHEAPRPYDGVYFTTVPRARTSEPACHPRVDWRFAATTMRSSRILFSLHELSLRVSIMCLFATAVVSAESYPNVVLCMCILCIRSIFWSFGVAQTAAALVASGVALHFRVDNASYRMISKKKTIKRCHFAFHLLFTSVLS